MLLHGQLGLYDDDGGGRRLIVCKRSVLALQQSTRKERVFRKLQTSEVDSGILERSRRAYDVVGYRRGGQDTRSSVRLRTTVLKKIDDGLRL